MRRVRPLAIVLTLLAPLIALPLVAAPAQATQAPAAFTSGALSTWQLGGDRNGTLDGIGWTTASAQGLVFVGGTFNSIRPPGTSLGDANQQARLNFAVFDAATGNPTSCAPQFNYSPSPVDGSVRSLNVSPDGNTLYIGGTFDQVNGVSNGYLTAMDIASCTIISTFKAAPSSVVRAIASTSDTVYFGGDFSSVNGQTRTRAAAVTAVGTASPGTLTSWAPTFDAPVRGLALKPDNSLVVAVGDFFLMNGQDSHAVGVVDTTGATVRAYPLGFIEQHSVGKAVTVDSTGFYVGNEGTGGGVFDGRYAVDWSTLNQRWRDTCLGATQTVVVYQGLLYSGSHAHDCSTMGWWHDGQRNHFLAESTQNDQLSAWLPQTNDGLGEGIGPRQMVVAHTAGSGDFMWSVGEFTTVNGVNQQGLTRFGQGVDTQGPATPITALTSPKQGQARITWRESTDTDDSLLTYNVYRDGSSQPLYTTSASSGWWYRPQLSYTDSNLVVGSTHSYKVTVTDGTSTASSITRSIVVGSTVSAYAQRVISDDASLLWRYDEPSDSLASDATDNNNSGLYRNAITYQVSPAAIANDPSKAISLPGTNAYISSELAYPAPSVFSTETWFKTTTTTGGQLIGFGDKNQIGSATYDRKLYMANDGTLIFGVNANGNITIRSPKSYNDGQWHLADATNDANGISLYVDGVRVARNSTQGTRAYSGYWRVGGDTISGWTAAPSSVYFKGSLDETAVYPVSLSASQIAEHYSLGTGTTVTPGPSDFYGATVFAKNPATYWRLGEASGTTAADASNSGATGTYSGGVTYGTPGAVAGTSDSAVTLNGSNGMIASSASVTAPLNFGVEAWIKTTTTSGGQIVGFGSASSGNSSTHDRQLFMRNDGKVAFAIKVGSTWTTLTTPGSYNDGTYHQVIGARDGFGMAIIVDGVTVAQNSYTGTPSAYTGFWRVGGDTLAGPTGSPSSNYLAGTVDEVAIYNFKLSGDQAASNYSAAVPSAADVAAPTQPRNISTAFTGGSVSLGWSASQDNVGVTGYNVYRSSTGDFTPSSSTLLTTTTATSLTDSPQPGQWYYKVVAVDAAGNQSVPSNQGSVYVTDVVAPTAPGSLTANGSSSSIALSWTASTDNVGVSGYNVYRSVNNGFTPSSSSLIGSTTATSLTDTPPTNGKYYYLVTAFDGANNVSATSNQAMGQVVDTTPPSTPGNVNGSVAGANVTVTWTAATDDVSVAGYDVYRGTISNFTPSASTKVGSTTTALQYVDNTAPVGPAYYKVIARDPSGNQSTPSASAKVIVTAQPTVVTLSDTADTYANAGAVNTNVGTSTSLYSRGTVGAISYLRFAFPTAPAGKTLTSAVLTLRTTTDSGSGSVEAHTVATSSNSWDESTLTWANKPAVTTPTLGTIAAGSASNSTLTTALDPGGLTSLLGASNTLTVTNTGTDSLIFWSKEFGTAAYRPTLTLTFSPINDTTPPSAPSSPSSSVAGPNVTISWAPSTDDVGVTRYDVYRSQTSGFTPTDSNEVASTAGTSVSDAPPTQGAYYYVITASDAANNTSALSPQVIAGLGDVSPPTAPGSVTAAVTTNNVALSWTASTDDTGVAGYNVYRSTTAGFTPDPSTLLGTTTSTSWSDATLAPNTYYYAVTAFDAANNVSPAGTASAVIADVSAPTVPTGLVASSSSPTVALTWNASSDDVGVTAYDVYRSATNGFTPDGTTKIASTTSPSYNDTGVAPGVWYYAVSARDAASNSSAASGQASVTVGDYTAPTAPGTLTATVTGTSVSLGWTASTDDVGVTSYTVYRSTTAGFTPSAGTQVASVTTPGYTDANLPSGTFYWVVTASDNAANTSAASNQVTATLAATVTTLNPTADTFANAGNTSQNNGTSTSLYSRGNVGAVTYLRFVLPTAPAGRTLTGVTLRLRTTTDTGSGSADPQSISVANDGWGETTLTWANKPAVTGPSLGTIAGGTLSNAQVDTALDVPTVTSLAGTQQTFAITSTSTDSFIAWSKEFGAASYRPQLILTYS